MDLGITEGILSIDGLRPVSSWERTGRYFSFPTASGVGVWIGTNFRLWRQLGRTPVWVTFRLGDWGHAEEVCALLEPWLVRAGVTSVMDHEGFSVGIDLPTGEEMGHVIRSVVDRLGAIAQELAGLGPREA